MDRKTEISQLHPGVHILGTTDQRGDGYDIAVAPHVDDYDAVVDAAQARGGYARKLYASGALCGYVVTIPDADEQLRLCQHSGNWGPWYHISLYGRTSTGRWAHLRNEGGHYNTTTATALGIPFGRPK